MPSSGQGVYRAQNKALQPVSVTSVSEDFLDWVYCRDLIRSRLGQDAVALGQLESLLKYATDEMNKPYHIGFFEQYSANFALFEDDIRRRHQLECLYPAGLANIGLGHRGKAEAMFRKVLAARPDHAGAGEQINYRVQELDSNE